MQTQRYYIDNQLGNDKADGLSPQQAFQTLEAINQKRFGAGDQILFKAGQVFEGGLKLQGSGSRENPIVIDCYTVEENEIKIGKGERPVIQGAGKVLYTVQLHNGAFWEINNLEMTNQGHEPLKGRTGVMISADEDFEGIDQGIVEHIYLKNLLVQDVNGQPEIKDCDNGGIFFCILSKDTEKILVFKDILIEGCHVKNVQRTGISFGENKVSATLLGDDLSVWDAEKIKTYLHQEVVIRNNYIEEVGGDGIVPMYSYRPLVEYNTSQEASKSTQYKPDLMFNAAIWPWQCYEATFQYNEAFRTYINGDGQAYDCDWSYRTTYKENYSHDNEGGFMLVCQKNAIESHIENNISYNDMRCLFMTSNVKPAYVIGNTFYLGAHLNTQIFSVHTGPGVFEENSFYKEGMSLSADWHEEGNTYNKNSYKGFSNQPELTDDKQEMQLGKVKELIKMQNELPDEPDEEALEKAYQAENQRRSQTLAEGGVIYGCQSYTKEQYIAYVKSNREVLAWQKVLETQEILEEQITDYYEQYKTTRYRNGENGEPFPKEMVRDHIRYELAKERVR